MDIDQEILKTLVTNRLEFKILNPIQNDDYLHAKHLCIAVLDSPTVESNAAAAMIVPDGVETDWIFCTEEGHRQLLFGQPYYSRLVLIGNKPIYPSLPTSYTQHPIGLEQRQNLEMKLYSLAAFFCPNSVNITFLGYYDVVIARKVVDIRIGSRAGEMIIEDVQITSSRTSKYNSSEFRRRLRFKDTPNFIQSQMPIRYKTIEDSLRTHDLPREDVWPLLDIGVLVPYLSSMVEALSLIAPYLDDKIRTKCPPSALCLGVGGGSLVRFLNEKLGFHVVGLEEDRVVLKSAMIFFGLKDSKSVRLICGDGIKLIEKLASEEAQQGIKVLDDYTELKGGGVIDDVTGLDNKTQFDVIMVDLDAKDKCVAITAPPLEFVKVSIFQAAKSLLGDKGILVINVISPDLSYYFTMVQGLREVFKQLYRIDVDTGHNFVGIGDNFVGGKHFVLIAADSHRETFMTKLISVVSAASLGSIVKLSTVKL